MNRQELGIGIWRRRAWMMAAAICITERSKCACLEATNRAAPESCTRFGRFCRVHIIQSASFMPTSLGTRKYKGTTIVAGCDNSVFWSPCKAHQGQSRHSDVVRSRSSWIYNADWTVMAYQDNLVLFVYLKFCLSYLQRRERLQREKIQRYVPNHRQDCCTLRKRCWKEAWSPIRWVLA